MEKMVYKVKTVVVGGVAGWKEITNCSSLPEKGGHPSPQNHKEVHHTTINQSSDLPAEAVVYYVNTSRLVWLMPGSLTDHGFPGTLQAVHFRLVPHQESKLNSSTYKATTAGKRVCAEKSHGAY